jgi:hypothetical protein
MGFFNRKQPKADLTIEDFKIETSNSKVSASISPELLKLLQKDGYGSNSKSGTSSSEIEVQTNIALFKLWKIQIKITFDNNEIENKDDFIKSINDKLDWLSDKKEIIYKRLTNELLELKNKVWLNDNETQLDEDSFISNIELSSLDFSSDGSFDLTFEENMMFGGHDITMTIDSQLKTGKPRI